MGFARNFAGDLPATAYEHLPERADARIYMPG